MQLSVPVPNNRAFYSAHQKAEKWRTPWHTPSTLAKKKGTHVPLALGQTIVPRLYYLWVVLGFQRTAVDMKQLINTQSERAFSSGPDADYRCSQTWTLIAHTLSFDATSRLQSGTNARLCRLCSAGLGRGVCWSR